MVNRIISVITIVFSIVTFYGQTTATFTSSGSFTVPCGVTSISVECWGGGGAGGGGDNGSTPGGSGGGGGGYVSNTLVGLTPGTVFAYTVGTGGNGGTGAGGNGGNSTFSTVIANGGTGGATNGGAFGTGGGGSGGTINTGGNGAAGAGTVGGGGGSSAGTGVSANGLPGVSTNGGTAPAGGGNGGDGNVTNFDGLVGTAPGGGGGGGGQRSGGSESGGNGGGGQITITYTASATSGCDPCSSIPITTFPYSNSGTTVGFSNFMTGGCPGNSAASTGNGTDVFYSLTVTADSYYTMSLTGTDATNIMELSILSAADCGGPWSCHTAGAWAGGLQTSTVTVSGNFLVTNDDTDSPCKAVWFPTAGTYYLKIDAGAGVSGPFTLNVDQYSPTALVNGGDGCSNAIGMSDTITQNVANTNCTYSSGNDDPAGALICAGTLENTVWLEFQSDGGGSPVTITVDGVNCADVGYNTGSGYYGGSGQFGIFTSSTDVCGGTYTSADPCQSLTTGDVYGTSLPNSTPTTYFLVWDGNGGAECDFSITATNVIALPSELVSFRLNKEENSNELLWEVASEQNLSHYIIESSADGITFNDIGTILASGNSNQTMYYTFSDFNYHLPKTYYKLRMVDYDGEKSYSNIVATDRSFEITDIKMNIYPNPSNGEFNLSLNLLSKGDISIRVLNLQGQLIYNEISKGLKGENYFNYDFSNLANGVYHIEVIQSNKKKTVQYIKQ
jgi:hypothetical protein